MARWEEEAEEALYSLGYDVIDSAQKDDYQGWCVRLGYARVLAPETILAVPDVSIDLLKEALSETGDHARQVVADAVEEAGLKLVVAAKPYAVLSWSYGSCSGCDGYEDMPREDVVKDLASNVEFFATEQDARLKFDARKGW